MLFVWSNLQVLSGFNSIVLARVNAHSDVEELKAESSVPVINALSDLHHPLQTLADLMTIKVIAIFKAVASPCPNPTAAPGESHTAYSRVQPFNCDVVLLSSRVPIDHVVYRVF